MSNYPFDPNSPLFPWDRPPAPLSGWVPSVPPSPLAYIPPDLIQPKRPRIFVSYQHSSDQAYYDLFSKTVHDAYESVFDNSLDRRIDSDKPDYVIQRIRDEFLKGSSCTIVLIGPTTYQRKFIDWEIKATLDKEHGLVGLQLPNVVPDYVGWVRLPERFNANINSGYAIWQGINWQEVISNPASLKHHIAQACACPKHLIVNPKEIKKQNG